jgi:DNA-binding LacI/PurR family transcriptional regulator
VAVSIKDIAKRAKVAPSTVSRALKDSPWISRRTRDEIVELARDMGYVPSAAARNLVARRSHTIGLCIPELANPSFAAQAKGIDDAASEHGFRVLVTTFYRHEDRELECVRDFQERRVDGIIIPVSVAYRNYLDAPDLFTPVVVINRAAFRNSVSTDRKEGARLLVQHLLELGHTRIAYVQAPDQESDTPRLAGYRSALAERDIPVREELLLTGNDQISGGIRAARLLVELPEPPTAVFAFNDITAIGIIHGLRELGYRVPEDFSVAGYDNLEIAAHYNPRLTTVDQPNYELGQQSFEMLLRLMRQEEPLEPVVLPPNLVIGGSTSRLSTATERRSSFLERVGEESEAEREQEGGQRRQVDRASRS